MNENEITYPFSTPFLSQFAFTPGIVPFTDYDIRQFDSELTKYEQIYLNPDIERSLISKNELLASFAISKAENSQLTLKEARGVYELLLSDSTFDFIRKKLKSNKKLTQKDHDKLEFFNVVNTFRTLNQTKMSTNDLSPEFILNIHKKLTQGLDVFKKYLPDFTVYKSGFWRDNDLIRVGDYVPAPSTQIEQGIVELITWVKAHPTPTGIAVFHTALYALHPFNNGNKRVCRILEHILLRSIGVNPKNLYSTSYYYHTQRSRYYKYLLFSLERTNLNYFVSFIFEALALSIVSVLKTSVEVKRSVFLDSFNIDSSIKAVLKPLLKRHELQFKFFTRYTRGKMARQTLVTYLQNAVERGVVKRREEGRNTYYSLSISVPEVEELQWWMSNIQTKISFIPDEFRLV
jgi:Fic family protein